MASSERSFDINAIPVRTAAKDIVADIPENLADLCWPSICLRNAIMSGLLRPVPSAAVRPA
jgi:hypothetical protein